MGETLCVAVGQKCLAVVAVSQCQNKWVSFILLKFWKFPNFDSFLELLNLAGED